MSTSVIIPTHNRSSLLRRCLALLPEGHEVVVVDDGSSPGELDRVKKVCEPQDRVLLITNVLPRGASAARNRGAAYAQGQWLCFLDDDDRLTPEYLELIQGYIKQHPEVQALVPNVQGGRVRSSGLVPSSDVLARNRVGGCSGFMIKKSLFEAIGGFDESFRSMQDWDLWICLQQRGALHYSGVEGVVYDSASQGKITHDLGAKYQGLRRLYLKHRSFWADKARRAHLRRLSVLRRLRSGQCGLWSNWVNSGFRLEAFYYTYRWRRFTQDIACV